MSDKPSHRIQFDFAGLPDGNRVSVGGPCETTIVDGQWHLRCEGYEAAGDTLTDAALDWLRVRLDCPHPATARAERAEALARELDEQRRKGTTLPAGLSVGQDVTLIAPCPSCAGQREHAADCAVAALLRKGE